MWVMDFGGIQKISQSVVLVAKYLVHLKVGHCQTLYVVSIFTRQNQFLTCIVEGGQNAPVCTFGSRVKTGS